MKTTFLSSLLLFLGSLGNVPVFTDRAAEAGLRQVVVSGGPEKHFLVESVGGGLGVIDYNKDGWMDLYIVNGGTIEDYRTGMRKVRNALYRNNQDGTFTDVTQKAGVEGNFWGKGVLVADFDNDGFDDLYVANYGPNLLYRNQGDGTFTEEGGQAGVADARWSSAAAAADYDKDGDLDLFVANYLDYDLDHLPVEGGKFCSYREIPVACGPRGLAGAGDAL
ncbi:MAG: FG-GAP repeat domain-containing protein, partial [Acidobacteriota bacterium]